MTTYHPDRHDLGITDASGNLIGMMLVKKNNTPQYSVFDDEYLASQFFSGVPGYGNLPPEKELAMREDSHHAGFGQEVYDGDDPHRYFTSYNADLRNKNQAILSYAVSNIPISPLVAPSIPNANMEAATSWIEGEQSSLRARGGTYSWMSFTDGGGSYNTVRQPLTMDARYKGRTFTYSCYCNVFVLSNDPKVWINDGLTSTNGAPAAQANTWVQLSASKKLSVAATAINVQMTSFGTHPSNCWWDDASISMATPVAPVVRAVAEYNDNLYFGIGDMVYKMASNGIGLSFVKLLSENVNITALEPFTDSRLYTALGTVNAYWSCNTAEAFVQATNTVVNSFTYLKTVHSATPTMWGSDSVYTIRSNTNPAEGGGLWSGQTIVGSSYYDITELIQQTGALYIMKEDMPYYLNSAGAVQNDLAPELAALTKATSGKNVKLWMNKLYIPCGEQALLENDAGTNRWLNPADFITNAPDFNGRVEALAYDDRYLFAILNNVNTSVEVLAGRDETIDGVTDWRWHSIAEVPINGCSLAFVSTQYQKRLYLAPVNATLQPRIYYIPLPTGYAGVATDVNRNFQDGGYFITPKLHGNFKDTNKAFPELTLTMAHTYNANVYWEAHYQTDSNTAWTKIADYTGTVNSMVQTNYLPDAGSVHPVATSLTLKFVGRTSYTDITPILTSYKLNGILYPPQRTIIAGIIRCANDVLDKTGQTERGVRASIIQTLDDARSATWPVSIRDIEGDTHTVKFLPLPGSTPRWMVVQDEKGREIERHYNVLMQVQTVAS